jgi:hypothetical protein
MRVLRQMEVHIEIVAAHTDMQGAILGDKEGNALVKARPTARRYLMVLPVDNFDYATLVRGILDHSDYLAARSMILADRPLSLSPPLASAKPRTVIVSSSGSFQRTCIEELTTASSALQLP